MNSRHAVVALVVCGFGAVVGIYLERRSSFDVDRRLERAARELEAAKVELINAAAPAVAGEARGGGAVELVAAVRAVVKEELAATCPLGSSAGETASGPAGTGKTAVRTTEMIAALDEGRALIGVARAQGRWGDEEADALRGVFPRLDDSGRAEVLITLTKAINLGELKIETGGALL